MTELHLWATVVRDEIEYDALITFTAECVHPGYAASWTLPGEGAEYECTFEHAELADGDKLTEAELATLRSWFVTHHDRAADAANDNAAGG